MKDIGPTAKGWLGSTGGVTDGGDLFVMVRFDSEGSARFNSARPEQDQWWSEFSKLLDGEATFKDSNNLSSRRTVIQIPPSCAVHPRPEHGLNRLGRS